VRVGYGLVYPMEAAGVFAMSACELPCWMGLEVGVTDREQIIEVLQSIPDSSLDMLRYERMDLLLSDGTSVRVNAEDGKLGNLVIYVETCPAAFLYSRGFPHKIEPDYRYQRHVTLYYSDGVVVRVYRGPDGTTLSSVYLFHRITFLMQMNRADSVHIFHPSVRPFIHACT
ncbi:MAG: hypothetical protein AAGK74_17760, partial [Chloroflexota bacterium]